MRRFIIVILGIQKKMEVKQNGNYKDVMFINLENKNLEKKYVENNK